MQQQALPLDMALSHINQHCTWDLCTTLMFSYTNPQASWLSSAGAMGTVGNNAAAGVAQMLTPGFNGVSNAAARACVQQQGPPSRTCCG